MKTTRMLGFLVLVALGILLVPGAALATLGSNTGDPNCPDFFSCKVDPNAQGTRFTGTMEIVWEKVPCSGPCRDGATEAGYFSLNTTVRANFNRKVYTFTNLGDGLCLSDVQFVEYIINNFINNTVVPGLGLTGTATLRSVTNVADPPLDGDPHIIWLMFDFEYAVK